MKQMNKKQKCPKKIKHGHCDECAKKKLKTCESNDCKSKSDVRLSRTHKELTGQWKCLCKECRIDSATTLSRSRSW